MNRFSSCHLVSVVFLLSAPGGAPAAVNLWRTEVQVSNGGNGVPLEFAFDGGLNAASSAQTLASPFGDATATAASELSVSGFIPALRATATHDGRRAQAVAWGVQGYTNVSADPVSTSLEMHFTADVTGSNDVEARLYLFEDENFEFSKDPGTILFESTSQLWPGFDAFANNLGPEGFDISRKNHVGPIDEFRTFDFTVAPGDSFYVWARLVATAENAGTADAFSTLTASFTNTAGLAPAAASIPEPRVAVWLVLALASVAALPRRRSTC